MSWLDRMGQVVYSKAIAGYTEIYQLKEVSETSVLVVGRSTQTKLKTKQAISTARASVIDRHGSVKSDFYLGDEGSVFSCGEVLRGGVSIFGGYALRADGKRCGILVKAGAGGELVYKYVSPTGERCALFEVIGNNTEYVCAAFAAADETSEASVVRLNNAGRPFYTTHLPARGFAFTALRVSVTDASVIAIGNSAEAGGIVYKLRPEGDVVFAKTVIPASGSTYLDHLFVARNGTILVGGNGEGKGYFSLLRSDGTSLYAGSATGILADAVMNVNTGESTITTFDPATYHGKFTRVSGAGSVEFERVIDGLFDNIKVNNSGEVMLLSRQEGRVATYSAFGEPLSGGYIAENKAALYDGSLLSTSGEIVFWGMKNRIIKLGHGLYISDVKITKPINGLATALFTVTLTGFSTNKEGVPLPVSVNYATKGITATEADNFIPVKGQLSFIPSKGESNQYAVKQNIEIPIKANNYVEGMKEFEVYLSGVTQSYLVKPVGKGIIEDQQAIVKLVRTEDGVEELKDIVYEIGLFKTDGTQLVNATGTDIIFDGSYGEGTADMLDFDIGVAPRIVIPEGKQTGVFGVKTLGDTRYELSKTVVVNFDKIHALSATKIAFEGSRLSCVGTLIDQPAVIAATSLGDHRVNNNMISGFFNLSLHRASDDALLTNATGDDIIIKFVVDQDGSARMGRDFVLTNQHDLRIDGDGNHSTVTLLGLVLYSTDEMEKNVRMTVESVQVPTGALPINISPKGQKVFFTIRR
ncbi:MAG: hypothetical protein LBP56_06080 [Odoribacteraceae bacterium]|nr:hypothetical protein [Odoribacteraceae bacterium]